MRNIKYGPRQILSCGVYAAIMLASTCGVALAQNAPEDSMSGSNQIGVIAFAVLFFGSCVGFFLMVWRNEKKRKQREKNTGG